MMGVVYSMLRTVIGGVAFSALAVVAARTAAGQQIAAPITDRDISDALRLAGDDKAAMQVLAAYELQTRAGWGNGPLIGTLTTPFARVVRAALAAHKKGQVFAATDVTADLVLPELHVIAYSQKSAYDQPLAAEVFSVSLAPRGSREPTAIIQPVRKEDLTGEYVDRYGLESAGPGVIAIFPLTALRGDMEVHVLFDRAAKGSSPLANCRECIVPIDTRKIR
jgi:hypothetical protein